MVYSYLVLLGGCYHQRISINLRKGTGEALLKFLKITEQYYDIESVDRIKIT